MFSSEGGMSERQINASKEDMLMSNKFKDDWQYLVLIFAITAFLATMSYNVTLLIINAFSVEEHK